MNRTEIVQLDKQYVWHPYTAMDEYIAQVDPLVIVRAQGSWLEDANGQRYLDGNSSWWMAALGHGHPRLLRVLAEQSKSLAHCALAGITHEPAARLAAELCAVAPPGLTRVFYTDNGSGAIEIAAKMAAQSWYQQGAIKKTRFVALDSAFHGETLGAASLGGIDVLRRPFAHMLFECVHVPVPSPEGYARAFDTIHRLVRAEADTLAAVFVEPIVQGAVGMRFYSPDYLRELRILCDRYDVLLVADEVFTGYGRTGPMWACAHAGISPDILCLGKAFAGLLPMGAALANDRVFHAFRGGKRAALYGGHTFAGNPLGAALAREVLAIFQEEHVLDQVAEKAPLIAQAFVRMQDIPGVVATRALGMVGAADLAEPVEEEESGYLNDLGWKVYHEALRRGVYVRPLGSTVYLCPPLTISREELGQLLSIFEESLTVALQRS